MRKRKFTPEEARQRQIDRVVEYNKQHKKQAYRNQRKSRSRSFIKKDATLGELNELESLINERKQELLDE